LVRAYWWEFHDADFLEEVLSESSDAFSLTPLIKAAIDGVIASSRPDERANHAIDVVAAALVGSYRAGKREFDVEIRELVDGSFLASVQDRKIRLIEMIGRRCEKFSDDPFRIAASIVGGVTILGESG
jgi:hypothetical protein